MTNGQQFWANVDKFVLGFFVVYFSVFAYVAVHGDPTNPFVSAMLDNVKTVLGALLGLVTGRAIQRAVDAPFMQPPPPPKVEK
jgi:hypothetical protein